MVKRDLKYVGEYRAGYQVTNIASLMFFLTVHHGIDLFQVTKLMHTFFIL